MRPILPFLFFILTSATLGCKDDGTDPPKIPERIKLTLIDVAVKEAYLHIAVTGPASNETLALQRNGATIRTFAAVADTNIADTALTQTTAYQYTARLTANTETTGTSNSITAQTLAPTSHNFTWQTFLLGDGNNSSLSDVAIINDTLIYVVGEMYLRDSTGAIGDTPYNVARWNGRAWEIFRLTYSCRIYYPDCWPPEPTSYGHGKSIVAFAPTDIWISAGAVFHFNGTTWEVHAGIIGVGDANRIWGTGSANLWFVGDGGFVVYYNGTTWRRLASGTTTRINDAWGAVNPVTGKEEVYCAVSTFFGEGDERILRVTQGIQVDSLRWMDRLLSGIWTNAGFPLYTSGDGVFENKSGGWREVPTGIYTNDIRGTALNNIVAVGDFGFITHYNGIDWQIVGSDAAAGYATVRVKSNLVVAVGRKNAQGIVTMGRR